MTASVLLEHLLVSLGTWVVGTIIGGGLGILIALRARTLFIAIPRLRRFSMFIPWRTVVLNLLIIPWTPAGILLVGFGSAFVWLNTSLVIFLFAMPFTASLLLEHWYPSPFAVRLTAGLRTLATASLVIAAIAGLNGGYGIGWYMLQSLLMLKYGNLLRECLILASLVLILDVLLGIIQLVVANRVGNGQQNDFVIQQSHSASNTEPAA